MENKNTWDLPSAGETHTKKNSMLTEPFGKHEEAAEEFQYTLLSLKTSRRLTFFQEGKKLVDNKSKRQEREIVKSIPNGKRKRLHLRHSVV